MLVAIAGGAVVGTGNMLWNLVANAATFTEPGGHVWLEIRRLERDVIIEVRDDGAGILRSS